METNKKGFLFSVTEDQIQEGFTKFLIENKDISPDATLNAKISQISKQYYLFALCEGPYTVHWGATSIWEHQEEYVTHKDKVIFVDKYGNEYNYQADGTTPLVKNVEEKNYKTVLDDLKIRIDIGDGRDGLGNAGNVHFSVVSAGKGTAVGKGVHQRDDINGLALGIERAHCLVDSAVLV